MACKSRLDKKQGSNRGTFLTNQDPSRISQILDGHIWCEPEVNSNALILVSTIILARTLGQRKEG